MKREDMVCQNCECSDIVVNSSWTCKGTPVWQNMVGVNPNHHYCSFGVWREKVFGETEQYNVIRFGEWTNPPVEKEKDYA